MPEVPRQYLHQLAAVAADLGRRPTMPQFSEHGVSTVVAETLRKRTGSWDAALDSAREARGEPALGREREWEHAREVGREELLAELRRVRSEVGEVPTRAAFDDASEHSEFAVRSEFGTWLDGLEAAFGDGVPDDRYRQRHRREA